MGASFPDIFRVTGTKAFAPPFDESVPGWTSIRKAVPVGFPFRQTPDIVGAKLSVGRDPETFTALIGFASNSGNTLG
jgi:hypothetical protein